MANGDICNHICNVLRKLQTENHGRWPYQEKFIPDDHDKPCYFYTKGNYLPKKNNVLTATVCVAKNLIKKTQVHVRVYSTDYQRPCDLPPILSK